MRPPDFSTPDGGVRLVLSLFPGVDLLSLAFKREGFCVVQGGDVIYGGDIRDEHYPPGKFDGVLGGPPCQAFSPLAHMVRHNGLQPKFGNLIPEFERVVSEAQPTWFLMENVPQAPTPVVQGYDVYSYILNNRQCIDEDGKPASQNRVRRISWGWRGENRPPLLIDVTLWESAEFDYAACGGTHGEGGISREQRGAGHPDAVARAKARKRGVIILQNRGGKPKRLNDYVGNNVKSESSFARLCRLQGLPPDFLADAPFTISGKCKAVGNGVPLPMGRAIARAVREAVTRSWSRESGRGN